MTLQDILNILNRYNLNTRVTWDLIKYDADKAIDKINDYLGACYPKMSAILQSPEHSYSVTIKNKRVPIFPERYILSIVIPFIASEILARDEEFTTVYNKYVMDVENGLFSMFQSEFNRIPLAFRQPADVGVFFEESTPQAKIALTREENLPVIEFRVHYHLNLEPQDAMYYGSIPFTEDANVYDFNSTIIVNDITNNVIINHRLGYYAYKFEGWSQNPRIVTKLLKAGDTIEHPYEDIHLYAIWNKDITVESVGGVVSIKDEYKSKLTTLHVPSIIKHVTTTALAAEFNKDCPNLTEVILPKTLQTISANTFVDFVGTITFPEYNYITEGPVITIASHAFNNKCIFEYVYIPYSVQTMEESAFDCTTTFYCEVLKQNRPSGWAVSGNTDVWCTSNSKIIWEASNVKESY